MTTEIQIKTPWWPLQLEQSNSLGGPGCIIFAESSLKSREPLPTPTHSSVNSLAWPSQEEFILRK